MPDHSPTWLERYQPYRRRAEVGFWIAVLLIQLVLNSITNWIELQRLPRPVSLWEPVILELSSNLTVGLLIPLVIAFERRFPLHWETLRRHLPWHVAGTLAFCAVHVLVMMAIRKAAFASLGSGYAIGSWPAVFGYEYLKDVRTYALILAAVLSYRLFLLRLQGEASVLDTPEGRGSTPPAADLVPRPERFLVRKLRKEFLIAAADIEWLQAQGNYVGLHVSGHDYLLRSTLAEFLGQLDANRFTQVHRSYVVNLDHVAEIEPQDGGDARLRMKDGSQVPCSRRYRDALGLVRR